VFKEIDLEREENKNFLNALCLREICRIGFCILIWLRWYWTSCLDIIIGFLGKLIEDLALLLPW